MHIFYCACAYKGWHTLSHTHKIFCTENTNKMMTATARSGGGRGGGGRGGGGRGHNDGNRGEGVEVQGPVQGREDAETSMIMSKVVSNSSMATYLAKNVQFFMWIYDTEDMRNLLLPPWFVNQLSAAVEEDQAEPTERKRADRKHFRNAVKDTIAVIDRHDPDTFPFYADRLNFAIFTRFMNTRKKAINVQIEGTDQFEEVPGYLSKSMYDGMRSALMHMYRLMGVQMDPTFQKLLAQYVKGLKRVVAENKKNTGQKLTEGKRPMSREVYKKICDILIKGESDEFLFAHCFLTLEWNLMARADNVVSANVSHVEWHGDSLVFYFAKMKGAQEGECVLKPWHVYGNPLEPEICPLLAFSKYVLTHPGVLESNGNNSLFPGNDQYRRFMGIFSKLLKDNAEDFKELGYEPNDLGSHSTRKGSETLVDSGSTVSPPLSAICLCAGWSMGSVKERYIHYEAAGDQFVGRTVCGLNCLNSQFAISPCYFDFTECENPDLKREELNLWMREHIVGGRELTAKILYMTRFLFANICYHYDYLFETCHPRNRLLNEPLLCHCPAELRQLAVVKCPWESTQDTPKISGIPPHVMMMSDLRRLESKLDSVSDRLMDRMVHELNERDIGGGMHHATQIQEQLRTLNDEFRALRNRIHGANEDVGSVRASGERPSYLSPIIVMEEGTIFCHKILFFLHSPCLHSFHISFLVTKRQVCHH